MNSSSNQANSATRGGQGSVSTPANSGGSGIFGSTSVGATHGSPGSGAGSVSAQSGSPGSPGNRRPSQGQAPMFGALSGLKRNSLNSDQTQRRTSLGEQSAQPGVLGTMWKNWTKGDGSN